MAAALHDIVIDQGATFTLDLTYTDPDGVAVDLYGYDARAQVRTAYADLDGDILADLTLDPLLDEATSGIIFPDEAAGEIRMQISATDTQTMPPGNWVYDLEVESGGGVVTRLVRGRALVQDEVTR